MCYIVVDLEMCRIPKRLRTKSFKWASETIQIGAVITSPTPLPITAEANSIKQNSDGIRLSRQVSVHLLIASAIPLLSVISITPIITVDKDNTVIFIFFNISPHFFFACTCI